MKVIQNDLFATFDSPDDLIDYCNSFEDGEKSIALVCAMIGWNTAIMLFNKPYTPEPQDEVKTILSAIREIESRYNLMFYVNHDNQIEVEFDNGSSSIHDLADLLINKAKQ